MRIWVGSFVAATCALGAAPAHASEPLVVVVQSREGPIDVQAIRVAIGEALERPALSPFDEEAEAARGTLTVLLDRGEGQARASYRRGRAVASWSAPIPDDADPAGLWLVPHAVALVWAAEPAGREGEGEGLRSCIEVIDPWGSRGELALGPSGYRLPSEVLNPFEDMPPAPRPTGAYQLPSEVIDPWKAQAKTGAGGGAAEESGRGLDVPRR